LSKLKFSILPLLFLFLVGVANSASAQQVSAYFGVGSATDGAATETGCPAKQITDSTGTCVPAPTIGGAFGVIGADVMIWPHLGFNFEDSFRFAQAPFLPTDSINARPSFYDFNAVYQPLSGDSRIVPEVLGGIGGAKVSLYYNQQGCVSSVCINQSSFLASANHFQVHGGLGVKLYVKGSMFIKPQVDFHYVPNLNQQYGSNFVPQYTVSIGYTFGR
jgi:hypothetical protein